MSVTPASVAKNIYHNPLIQGALRESIKVIGRDRLTISRYLKSNPVRRLQIGAGANIRPGWLNTNWYPILLFARQSVFLDATKRFPLPDASFDYIFSEHMIEHVPYDGGLAMLRECLRVLKPGGKLRIATPDMAFVVDLLNPQRTPQQEAYIKWAAASFLPADIPATPISVVNNFVRDWGHVYIYDKATLADSLEKAGFVGITPFKVSESDDPELAGIDNCGRMPDGFMQLESMTFQASKPG